MKRIDKIDKIVKEIKSLRKERFDLSTETGITDMKKNSSEIKKLLNKMVNYTY